MTRKLNELTVKLSQLFGKHPKAKNKCLQDSMTWYGIKSQMEINSFDILLF